MSSTAPSPSDVPEVHGTTPASSRARQVLVSIALLLGSTLFALLLVECGARILLYGSLSTPQFRDHKLLQIAHPKRGWQIMPNGEAFHQTLDYAITTRTNSRGMNDDEVSYEKPPGTFRIVLLGDSFMFAREVTRQQALPYLLEQALAAQQVEVINLGTPGYGTIQQYFYLQEEGLKYAPDLVLVSMFLFNDLRDNAYDLNARIWAPEYRLTWGRPYAKWNAESGALEFSFPDPERNAQGIAEQVVKVTDTDHAGNPLAFSAMAMLVQTAANKSMARLRPPKHAPEDVYQPYLADPSLDPAPAALEESWQITGKVLGAMRDMSEAAGAAFAVFAIPTQLQTDPAYQEMITATYPGLELDLDRPDRRLAQIGAALEFPVILFADRFREAAQAGEGPFHFQIEDVHFNAAGHAFATKILAQELVDAGLVPPASGAD